MRLFEGLKDFPEEVIDLIKSLLDQIYYCLFVAEMLGANFEALSEACAIQSVTEYFDKNGGKDIHKERPSDDRELQSLVQMLVDAEHRPLLLPISAPHQPAR
jgi:hypothetical protein